MSFVHLFVICTSIYSFFHLSVIYLFGHQFIHLLSAFLLLFICPYCFYFLWLFFYQFSRWSIRSTIYQTFINLTTHSYINSFIHLSIHSFILQFIHSFNQWSNNLIYSSLHSFVHLFIHFSIYSSIHSTVHLPIYLFICPFIHLFIHSFNYSSTNLFIHSFIPSFISPSIHSTIHLISPIHTTSSSMYSSYRATHFVWRIIEWAWLCRGCSCFGYLRGSGLGFLFEDCHWIIIPSLVALIDIKKMINIILLIKW